MTSTLGDRVPASPAHMGMGALPYRSCHHEEAPDRSSAEPLVDATGVMMALDAPTTGTVALGRRRRHRAKWHYFGTWIRGGRGLLE